MDSKLKMETHKIQFKCRILRNIENGFTALEDNSYIINFQDKKLRHQFNPKEEVVITIENVEIEGNEIISGGSSVIYCVLRNFMSNGLQFADYTEKGKETFFWDYRGMITHRTFEKKDVFERDDILRISIQKLE